MGIDKCLKTATVIGMIALTPAFCAAAAETGVTQGVTSESFSSDYYQHASYQLNDIRQDAQRIAYRASELKAMENNPEQTDWEAYGRLLNHIKAEVDDMGRRLSWLETVQSQVPPAQKTAVRQAAPLVRYMADNTDDAINYLNSHKGDFWAPSYERYTRNLSTEATTLARRIHTDERFAQVEDRDQYLQRNVGMLTVFGK